jgi:hypothetical protein
MKALNDFARGIRASFARPAAVALAWLYAIASLVTAIFAATAFFVVGRSTAGSEMANELRQGITADWLLDLATRPAHAAALFGLAALGSLLVLIYLALAVVTTGGVVSALARAVGVAQVSPDDTFWAASLRHVGVTARVALLEVLALAAAFVALAVIGAGGVLAGLGNGFRWSWLAAGAVTLALVTTLFDFARLRVVVLGERSAINALSRGARAMLACAPSILLVITCCALLAIMATGVVVWAHSGMGKSTAAGVFTAALVGQLSVVVRLWCRLVSYGAEISLWSRCRSAE